MSHIDTLYTDYPEMPYISPDRDIESWIRSLSNSSETKVPRRNMVRTTEGLLPGEIILLWRISLGTFTTESWFPKYFEYTYGINAKEALVDLINQDYAQIMPPLASLDHVNATFLKNILKDKGVKGYSKWSKEELKAALTARFTNDDIALDIPIRGIELTSKGEAAVANNQAVIGRHPMKPMYS